MSILKRHMNQECRTDSGLKEEVQCEGKLISNMKGMASNDARFQNYFMRMSEVVQITGLGRSTIYSKINPKSKYYDPTFPKQVHLGQKCVRFACQEVYAWINALIDKRNGIHHA